MKDFKSFGNNLYGKAFVMWLGVSFVSCNYVWVYCYEENTHVIKNSKLMIYFKGTFVIHGEDLFMNILELYITLSTS
jgi:hypothetical protein